MSNIFDSECDALVNPVNCAGVMGAGLALQFKERFPDINIPYKRACRLGLLSPGKPYIISTHSKERPLEDVYIICFATKNHWRDRSTLEDIDAGLEHLLFSLEKTSIKSIAMPKIGCGLGGLDWKEVKPLIEDTFKDSGIRIEYYE